MSEAALAAAVEAARAAGRVALKYYHGGFEITLKADATPVTQADREAERTIVEILKKAFPEHGFLGEEFGGSGATDTRWIIDPIDGTKNFVRRIPIWATLIGLEERGEITVGVIHNPVTGELYTARKGGGAFLNGERIRISDETDMRQAYLMHAGLRAARTTRYWDGFMRLVGVEFIELKQVWDTVGNGGGQQPTLEGQLLNLVTEPNRYTLPAFYELFAQDGPQVNRERWERIAEVSRGYFVTSAHPTTGLHPDYAEFDGTPTQGYQASNHDTFRFDA